MPSPSAQTRQEQKQTTRRALVAAARRVLTRRGYSATTIPEIVREAGVAHGTFYVHFAGKEALVDALLAEFNAALAARLAPVLVSGPSGRGREELVRGAARAFLDQLESDPSFVSWVVERMAAGLPSEALRDGVNPPALQLLVGALSAEAAGRLPASRLTLAAQALLALWIRVGLQRVSGPGVSRDEAEDVLVTMTVGALGALLAPDPNRVDRVGAERKREV